VVFSMPDSLYFLIDGFFRVNNMGYVATSLLKNYETDMAPYVFVMWFFMAAICIVVGYVFVGIVVWIERGMLKRGKFKDEPAV